MLTLTDSDRRGFLTAGSLALGGLALPDLLRAAESRPSPVTGRSIVFVFQQGGPSQFETFDPKPGAASGVRTVGGVTKTSLPGVVFGEHLPRLAALAHKLTVVRSFQTLNAEHNIVPIVSPDSGGATLGALHSRVVGSVRADTGVPTNAVLFPQSARADVAKGAARGDLTATGGVGRAYAPFIPGAGGPAAKNMELAIPRDRLDDRRRLRSAFDSLARALDADGASERSHEQAVRLLLGGRVGDALDLTREPAAVRERYDTTRFDARHGWAKTRRGARGYYSGHARSIGSLMLMARRLCEAGCGFVTVHSAYEGVWDLHGDGENLNTEDGTPAVARPFDHAVAAFIEDVEARGLSDRILLVCCGEMGRTPRLNRFGGRDHWAKVSPLMLYGGGLRGGRVIGATTPDGGEPTGDECNPKHLISTLLNATFDVGQLRLMPGLAAVAKLGEHPTLPGVM